MLTGRDSLSLLSYVWQFCISEMGSRSEENGISVSMFQVIGIWCLWIGNLRCLIKVNICKIGTKAFTNIFWVCYFCVVNTKSIRYPWFITYFYNNRLQHSPCVFDTSPLNLYNFGDNLHRSVKLNLSYLLLRLVSNYGHKSLVSINGDRKIGGSLNNIARTIFF